MAASTYPPPFRSARCGRRCPAEKPVLPVVVVAPGQLRCIKSQRGSGPSVVASLALGTAGETPRLLPHSVKSSRVLDFKRAFCAGCVHKCRISLLVVPLICVRHQLNAIEVQNLRFDTPTRGGISLLHVQRQCLHQHGNRSETSRRAFGLDRQLVRHGKQSLRHGMIRPRFCVDGVWNGRRGQG